MVATASQAGRLPWTRRARPRGPAPITVTRGALSMQAPTQDHHDWKAAEYAARWVADAMSRDDEREGQLALLAALIPRPRDAAIRVLDLGAGYGIVSDAVLRTFPAARITLMDYSAAMLEH